MDNKLIFKCTILTLVLLCKINLYTCIDNSSYEQTNFNCSSLTSKSSYASSDNESTSSTTFRESEVSSSTGNSGSTDQNSGTETAEADQSGASGDQSGPSGEDTGATASETDPSTVTVTSVTAVTTDDTSAQPIEGEDGSETSNDQSEISGEDSGAIVSETDQVTITGTESDKSSEVSTDQNNLTVESTLLSTTETTPTESKESTEDTSSSQSHGSSTLIVDHAKFASGYAGSQITSFDESLQKNVNLSSYTNTTIKFSPDTDASLQDPLEIKIIKTSQTLEENQKSNTVAIPYESQPHISTVDTESSQSSDTAELQLIIIDVSNKQSTGQVDYKKDDTTGFEIFTAKDPYIIYSVKKDNTTLWKSTNNNYPNEISFKERQGETPLIRVFNKKNELTNSESSSSKNINDNDIEVIEVRKPKKTNKQSQTSYQQTVNNQTELVSEDESGFTTDDTTSASYINFSDPNEKYPFKVKNQQNLTSSHKNIEIDIKEMGQKPKQSVKIAKKKSQDEELAKISEKLNNLSTSLSELSQQLNITSYQSTTPNINDTEISEHISKPKSIPIVVEDHGPTRYQSNLSTQTDIKASEDIKNQTSTSQKQDEIDIVIVDSRSSPTSPQFQPTSIVSSYKQTTEFISALNTQPTHTYSQITHTSQPSQTSHKYSTDHSHQKLRGHTYTHDHSKLTSTSHSSVSNMLQKLKIHTINDDGVTTSQNDDSKYDITLDSDTYTFTFKQDVKCVKVEYNSNVWIYKISDPDSKYPTSVILSSSKFRIEFPGST